MSTVFSMIQPSGKLGIGHYLGAIKHWKKAEEAGHDCLFAVANLHAISVPQQPTDLKERTLDLVAFYLACGIDPEKSTLFIQSDVSYHAELAWVLSCITSMGELNRMTQFKDKSKKQERIGVGLFSYPALMAADILLYQADIVPVGEDQKQHIELVRNLAERFNQTYGEAFVVPTPQIAELGSRVMSLGDPYKKMSKSDENSHNYIALEDSASVIKKKVMRAVTDSLNNIYYDPDNQKGLANLIELYAVCADKGIDDVVLEFKGRGYGEFKKALGELLSDKVSDIYQQYERYRGRTQYLEEIVHVGAENARERARKTLDRVYDLVGLSL